MPSTPVVESRWPIGLSPRKAANSVLTGGRPATCAAAEAGTPWLSRPEARAPGSVPDSPAIMREKKTPMDRALPVTE